MASTFSTTLLPLYSEIYGRSGLGSRIDAHKFCEVSTNDNGSSLSFGQRRQTIGPLDLRTPIHAVGSSFTFCSSVFLSRVSERSSPLLIGTDRQRVIAKYGTAVAVLNLAMDIMLIPRYGAVGAAIANCSAQIIGVIGGTTYVFRCSRTGFPWRSTAVIYLAGTAAVSLIAYSFSRQPSGAVLRAASLAAGAVVYVAILATAGELGRRDLGVLKGSLLPKVNLLKPVAADD